MRHKRRGTGGQQKRGRRKGQARILHITCLLQLLRQDLHGYEILQGLNILQSQDSSSMDPSIVYRIMREFEREGLVSSYEGDISKGPQRRMYTLSSTGREQLKMWLQELLVMKKDIQCLLDMYAQAENN
ncbi:MAG: PadR family transcriptional regulator [Deltaproteobacteria bacterium]|nr:MAG: PadR family transcriptional regulator [Deltaproteobacteria bacterium]